MIGRLIAEIDGAEAVAEMDDSGAWRCPDRPDLENMLNSAFNPRPGYSPAYGRFGVRQLNQAAELLGGRVEIEPRDPGPPGRIY